MARMSEKPMPVTILPANVSKGRLFYLRALEVLYTGGASFLTGGQYKRAEPSAEKNEVAFEQPEIDGVVLDRAGHPWVRGWRGWFSPDVTGPIVWSTLLDLGPLTLVYAPVKVSEKGETS